LINAFLNGATSPAGQISHPGAFGFDSALQPYPYDPAKAKALLAEAGYAGGFAFTTVIDASAGGNYTGWYQQVAQYLAAVGVHMTVRAAPTSQITEYVLGGKWPVEAFGWTFAGFDSLRGYRFRSCEMKPAYNCDPDLMPMIAAAENATTETARRTATQAVLAAERDRPPGIILWQKVDFDALSKRVGGFSVVNDRIAWDKISLSPK
jgi:peptide/nickel transport system substrate-binding protein